MPKSRRTEVPAHCTPANHGTPTTGRCHYAVFDAHCSRDKSEEPGRGAVLQIAPESSPFHQTESPEMSNNRGTSDTPKCDVAACTRARPRSLQRFARLWRPPSRIGRKLPGRPRFSSQANVGLSCEPRKQAERRASDALRSVGVRQIQARVGLCLGPSLASRSGQCRERLGVLTIPVGGLRPGAQPSGGGRQLRSSWTASCPIER